MIVSTENMCDKKQFCKVVTIAIEQNYIQWKDEEVEETKLIKSGEEIQTAHLSVYRLRTYR